MSAILKIKFKQAVDKVKAIAADLIDNEEPYDAKGWGHFTQEVLLLLAFVVLMALMAVFEGVRLAAIKLSVWTEQLTNLTIGMETWQQIKPQGKGKSGVLLKDLHLSLSKTSEE